MVPENLKDLVDQYLLERSERLNDIPQKDIPEFGDIVNVEGKLLFVYKVHEDRGFCNAFLAHTVYEFTTSDDAILKRSETTLLFDIVVQTDCPVNLFFTHIKKYVGETNDSFDKTKLNQAWKSEGCGTKLLSPLDARWSFKETQGQITNRLTEAVTYHNLYCLEEGIPCNCLESK